MSDTEIQVPKALRLSASDARDLYALTFPVSERFIKDAPQGKYGEYVPHHVLTQMLLAAVGPYTWELVELLRGHVPQHETDGGRVYRELNDAVIGCIYRLTVTIDGRTVSIEEAGSCDLASFENNDAERLKKAASDAFKRCVMRIGLGIQLWCDEDEFLIHSSLVHYDEYYRTESEKPFV